MGRGWPGRESLGAGQSVIVGTGRWRTSRTLDLVVGSGDRGQGGLAIGSQAACISNNDYRSGIQLKIYGKKIIFIVKNSRFL